MVDVGEIAKAKGGRVRLSLTLTPVSLSIDGLDAPLPAPSSIELEALTSGAIEKVVGSTLFSPGSAAALEASTLLAEHRPPLPRRAVTVGDTWPVPLEISNQQTKLALTGTGTLSGFELFDRRRVADVSIRRTGQVTSSLDLGKAPVQLKGTSQSTVRMLLDIDKGQIVESVTRSTTRYSMSFAGGGAAGTIVARVDGKLVRV